ncbi:tetratricopeptide repeat family protein, putative [Plasmodium sp. gorilla clade G3]|nr:tetratricopeptide repeat family protein, putative [Plasmodium sp. gorilla clade G3]
MIYLKGENKIISINEDDINDENYIIIKSILKDEKICMNGWIKICFIFYEKNYYKLFLDLIKEGDIFFEDYNNKIFNILLLVYNLEKIINVKNENKEDELKIKLENLLNQIEKKIKEKNENDNEKEKYNSDIENKHINISLNNTSECDNKNYYNKYDYLSYLMIKGIYNINMYLYLLNKYDNKCGTNHLFSSSVIKKTIDASINVNGNVIINNNEFTNPLNYLIDSINIFILLLKKNNFDFISSIYLSFALCLIYKLDACIQFSSYVLIRIIHFQNFLNVLLENYKIKYVDKYNNGDNTSIRNNNIEDVKEFKDEKKKTVKKKKFFFFGTTENEQDNIINNNSIKNNCDNNLDNTYKCIEIKNLLNISYNIKSILKYIIGICYLKKKNFSMASYCFTSSIKIDNNKCAYISNSSLLLMNYVNKIIEHNDFIYIDEFDFLKYSNNYLSTNDHNNNNLEDHENDEENKKYIKIGTHQNNTHNNNINVNRDYEVVDISNEGSKLDSMTHKEQFYHEENIQHKVEKNTKSYQTVSISNNNNFINHLRKVHMKDIINLTLFYYYNYLEGGILKCSQNLNLLLNCSDIYILDKNDIYEYDESIESVNNENIFVKNKKWKDIYLNNNIISLYFDLCEIWLIQGNFRAILLLKIIKHKINFNYINKKSLSKYYFLIGIYYHILQNIKKALMYYHKSFLIYKNNISRYYYTICCIHLKKYNKAKSNLIYLYKKCRNAYVIKLYIYFFVHTSNIYLNYNVLNKETIKKKEINKRENKNDISRNDMHKNDAHKNDTHKNDTHKNDTHKNDTHKNDTHKNDTHMNEQTSDYVSYHIDNKFCKSNRSQHVKILHKVLLNMVEIINKNEMIFDNNLDIILLKAKIYELLITKYSNEYIESYFKLLDDVYEVKYFFTIKNKSPKLSLELINNYIVSMFYCNYKEKSLELIELLKDEIFCKIKRFHKYFTHVILCKGKSFLCNMDNLLNKDKLYNATTKKEENHIHHDKNNKRKSNCDNTTIDHNNKRRKNEIHDKDLKSDEQNCYDEKKKDEIDINEKIHFHENIINSINGSKLKCKEMLKKNIKKLKYIKDILRYHRIFEIQNNIINIKNHNMIKKKNTLEIYNKTMKNERYINLINYLKKVYITICFNNIMLLEIVGYKYISINMYKIFTEIYINYESAFIRLANIYIKNKNFLKAKQIIDSGLEKNPSSIKLHLLKSYMHFKRKHYDYSIYTLEKLKREDENKNINKNNLNNNDSILINTYISIIKFHKIKECKSKGEKNSIINEIYNKIQLLLEKKSNYFIANLIGVLLNINNKYDIAYESFQIIIDSYEKLSFYYISSIKNIIYLMFNHLIRNNLIINNKLFLNKLNLFFNLSIKYGLNDKKIYLCYSNYLHVMEKYDDAINLLYFCYKKWPYDISILNSLIIIIDSCVSKYLSYEYVDLKNIFFMKGLIHFSFQVIYTLLYLKHFTTTAPLLSSDEKYNYYKEEDYIIEIKKKNLEILASRKYLISTYKKFEEKIKPYIESSLPTMLKQKKLYEMKKVNIQKKIYEEKKRKEMNLEMMKLKSEEKLHEELLRDVNEITYHISDKINVSEQRDNSFYINDHQNDIIQETDEIQLDSIIHTPSNKNIIDVEEENLSFQESPNYESSDNSSDLFEEPSPKKRKKVID